MADQNECYERSAKEEEKNVSQSERVSEQVKLRCEKRGYQREKNGLRSRKKGREREKEETLCADDVAPCE